MNDPEDITPEDSCVSVFLDTTPLPIPSEEEMPSLVGLAEQQRANREAAVVELIEKGFSESTARMMIGLPPTES